MSKHQAFRDAIEAFEPGAADAPILYSTTEVNEKGFRALLGRKATARPFTVVVAVCVIAILVISTASTIAFGQVSAPTFAAMFPVFFIFFFLRTTVIAVTEQGLDFYFVDAKRGKQVAYDKMSLPFDRITNMKVRPGRWNTSFTFEFLHEEKTYKIKTSVPNKMKKMAEQAENLKRLRAVLEQKHLNPN